MTRKRWRLRPTAPADHLARFPHLSPLLVQVLHNRGITQPADVQAFLEGTAVPENPFRLKGMNEAVARLRRAIRAGEPIAVYGDFDVDGVTATTLLVEVLSSLGAQVRPYIPHRVDEGYGLNKHALYRLRKSGVSLVVTVDCGVRSVSEIEFARRIGLDVIVTDHHTVPPELPPAVAVINPHQPGCPYPFKELAGVGLAYKLAQALLRTHARVPLPGAGAPPAEEDLLELVALGTVVDVAPLTGENRVLVRRGLELLRGTRRPGLRTLMALAGLEPTRVDTEALSYAIGPRLNAAGRLEHAITSYRLMMSQEAEEAARLAQELDQQNRRRQELTLEHLERAQLMAVGQLPEARLLFVAGEGFLPGIVGLVAGKLSELFYRPAVVVQVGPEESRGSARSIPEFDISAALDRCSNLLVRHGGHAAAAGFTVANKNLEALQRSLQDMAAEALGGVELVPTLEIDATVPLSQVTWQTLNDLERLAPFGEGNPPPVLMSPDVLVRDHRLVGSGHLKLTLSDGAVVWDAIAFRQGEWAERLPRRIDVAYCLEANVWNDQQRLQLNIQDLRPAES